MDEFDALFNKNFKELKILFPNKLNSQTRSELKRLYNKTETDWKVNIGRYSNKKEIKYLLICEAPSKTGAYFYSNTKTSLFTKVWNTFFINPVCSNQNNAYQCLANEGFLLIDSLPFAMKYTSSQRKKDAYSNLVKNCLPWWLNKLNNNFTFANDLKIAFGFKLNAMCIINTTNGSICLGGINHIINCSQIAADISHRWQPSTANLQNIFKITPSTRKICP